MFFKEGEAGIVIKNIDQAIAATRIRWAGKLAGDVLRVNKTDTEAEDLALAYANGEHISRAAAEGFLENRRSVSMWAALYPADPEDSPSSTLLMMTVTPISSFYSVIYPFKISPAPIDSKSV